MESIKDCWMDEASELEKYLSETGFSFKMTTETPPGGIQTYGMTFPETNEIKLFKNDIEHNKLKVEFNHLAVHTSMRE